MNSDELLAILPSLALTLGTVIVMLVAAFARYHSLVARLTSLVCILSTLCIYFSAGELPITVTPLLKVDRFALLMMVLFNFTALYISIIAYPYFEHRKVEKEEFYILLLVALLGAQVLACANHFASLLLGLEIMGVALFALIAYNIEDYHTGLRGLEAGVKYLVLSGVASALLLFGAALLYAGVGTLSFDIGFGEPTRALLGSAWLYGATVLLMVGIAFKLSLVPFHLWTPDVYQGAAAPVSTLIATLSKAAVFAVMLRYFIASESLFAPLVWQLIAVLAALSMLVGNWLALLQNNLKRLLAYSSIAHLGYLLIAFLALRSYGVAQAVEGALIYLVAYVLTSLGAFGIVVLLSSHDSTESETLEDFKGLFWQVPGLSTILTLMLLSLAGIPLTLGFIGKFYLITVGSQADLWWLLAALILGSAIGLYYYLRVINTLFQRPSKQPYTERSNKPRVPTYSLSYGIIIIVALLILGNGLYPQVLIHQSQAASANFMTQQNKSIADH